MEVYAVFQQNDKDNPKDKTLCVLFTEKYLADQYIKRSKTIRKNDNYICERWRVHYKEVF